MSAVETIEMPLLAPKFALLGRHLSLCDVWNARRSGTQLEDYG